MSAFPNRQIKALETERGLVGGPFGSSLGSRDYVDDGVPVIRGTNLGLGREVAGDFVFVDDAKASGDLARNLAVPGDLVFTQRGTLGQVARVPSDQFERYVVSQSQMRLRVDHRIADPDYVYYACMSDHFNRQIHDNAIATGVPHINLGILGRLTIPMPPVDEQRAIGEVLGALDDKIAANRKLAETADQLANALFASAKRELEASCVSFGELAVIGGGGTPSTSVAEYWDGDINWATPTDVTGLQAPYLSSTGRTITQEGLANCSSALYPAGSILMTSRATIGAFAIAEVATAVNQGFIVVNTRNVRDHWWLFHDMRSRVSEFISHANGATFLELPRGRFKSMQVSLPDAETVARFSDEATVLHESASAAQREMSALATLRDTLLPRLMSGELRVRDAERAVEEVV